MKPDLTVKADAFRGPEVGQMFSKQHPKGKPKGIDVTVPMAEEEGEVQSLLGLRGME